MHLDVVTDGAARIYRNEVGDCNVSGQRRHWKEEAAGSDIYARSEGYCWVDQGSEATSVRSDGCYRSATDCRAADCWYCPYVLRVRRPKPRLIAKDRQSCDKCAGGQGDIDESDHFNVVTGTVAGLSDRECLTREAAGAEYGNPRTTS